MSCTHTHKHTHTHTHTQTSLHMHTCTRTQGTGTSLNDSTKYVRTCMFAVCPFSSSNSCLYFAHSSRIALNVKGTLMYYNTNIQHINATHTGMVHTRMQATYYTKFSHRCTHARTHSHHIELCTFCLSQSARPSPSQHQAPNQD